ncbi:MAG: hypothetical protein MUP47_10030, partial [Phycisphaerae bacterium]|nr:hypothetical protein [Phycisphaerae bacterium]
MDRHIDAEFSGEDTPMAATPPPEVPVPREPVRFALIGAGARSHDTYPPLLEWLRPCMELVAVCDPVAEHADA